MGMARPAGPDEFDRGALESEVEVVLDEALADAPSTALCENARAGAIRARVAVTDLRQRGMV